MAQRASPRWKTPTPCSLGVAQVGLEFLVAADIIRSVAIDPTFQSVGVLGLIVLIRTFLSWSLVVEITGGWPWQRAQARSSTNVRPDSPPRL